MNTLIHSIPGLLVVAILALLAWLVADVLGGSALLYAVVLGLLVHPFLTGEDGLAPRWRTGADLAAGPLLKLGVALLGSRITFEQLLGLGWEPLLLVLIAVPLTLLTGVAGARLLGQGRDLGILTGGAVAICGASAALALAAILPRSQANHRILALTVIAVTILSLVAMVFYPWLAQWVDFTSDEAGLLLGATIHNVPQAVAAGFVHSPQAGEVATFMKLLRVAMLLPVVLVLSLILHHGNAVQGSSRPPLLPWFLLGFVGLVILNSLDLISLRLSHWLEAASDALLLGAMAAIGLQSSARDLLSGGWRPLLLLLGETVLLLVVVLLFLLV